MVKIAGNPPSVGKTNIVSLSKSSAVLIQSSNAFLSLSCSFQNTALLSKSFICRHELIGEGPKPSEPSLFVCMAAGSMCSDLGRCAVQAVCRAGLAVLCPVETWDIKESEHRKACFGGDT